MPAPMSGALFSTVLCGKVHAQVATVTSLQHNLVVD